MDMRYLRVEIQVIQLPCKIRLLANLPNIGSERKCFHEGPECVGELFKNQWYLKDHYVVFSTLK